MLRKLFELNLADPEQSRIKYKISKFPDGQQDIVIDINSMGALFSLDDYDLPIVTILSRFNSFADLELILCTTKALRNLNIKTINLFVPYILGARSDRKFQEGGTSYLHDVIAPILNAQNYNAVVCTDIHNPVMASACINNLVVQSNISLVGFALTDIYTDTTWREEVLLIAPDAGASKKIFDVTKQFGVNPNRVVVCSKTRELDGKISKTDLPDGNYAGKTAIIIDDICDGGRTFIEIAKLLQAENCFNIYLIVTHGIFSAGFDELEKYFRGIYCTNSVKDILFRDIIPIRPVKIERMQKFIKQLEII